MTTLDEKYEDEGYRYLMKNFAASAASGDLAGLEKGLAEVILVQFHCLGIGIICICIILTFHPESSSNGAEIIGLFLMNLSNIN